MHVGIYACIYSCTYVCDCLSTKPAYLFNLFPVFLEQHPLVAPNRHTEICSFFQRIRRALGAPAGVFAAWRDTQVLAGLTAVACRDEELGAAKVAAQPAAVGRDDVRPLRWRCLELRDLALHPANIAKVEEQPLVAPAGAGNPAGGA